MENTIYKQSPIENDVVEKYGIRGDTIVIYYSS